MKPRSPFSFVQGFASRLPIPPQAPQWLVQGVQHRLVLLLNHVLMQEPQAMERLARHSGCVARVQWRQFVVALQMTPAGLLDVAPVHADADLRAELLQGSPVDLARSALAGDPPQVHIEGNVQLAGDIHWLAENLRWDIEEDLARIVGDAPAHFISMGVRRVLVALHGFAGRRGAADHLYS